KHALRLFFFNDTATTEIYTLSLHDALPISHALRPEPAGLGQHVGGSARDERSEEHTSELQSRLHLVCRLLLEKKKQPRHKFLTNKSIPTKKKISTIIKIM